MSGGGLISLRTSYTFFHSHDYKYLELHVAEADREIIQMLREIAINKDINMMDQRLTSDAYARDVLLTAPNINLMNSIVGFLQE